MYEPYQAIGETAGKIYRALEQQGEQSAARVQRQISVEDSALFNQAIGWLAREDKISFNKSGKIVTFSLLNVTAGCCKTE